MEPADVDWNKGLPLDVLALVAKSVGFQKIKAMRSVCKAWQQGFELGVSKISVQTLEMPVLAPGPAAAQHFQALTRLDLENTESLSSWLGTLRFFPNLDSVSLGRTFWQPADFNMVHLRVST